MPEAHIILWVAGLGLALWGVSLVVRGAAGSKPAGDASAGTPPTRRSLLMVFGFGAMLAGGLALLAGLRFYEWTRLDPDTEPTMTLWEGGVLVAGALSILFATWAITGDRSWGRPRCPACWYNMSGVPSLRCPECGRQATGVRDLRRPRRHPRLAIAGILAVLCSAMAWEVPLYRASGPMALVPTTVLIAGLWRLPSKYVLGDSDWSLWGRLNQRRLFAWQESWFRERLRSGVTNPGSPESLLRAMHLGYRDTHAEILACARWMSQGDSALAARVVPCVMDNAMIGPSGFVTPRISGPEDLDRELAPYAKGLQAATLDPDPLTALTADFLLGFRTSESVDPVGKVFEAVGRGASQSLWWRGAWVLNAFIECGRRDAVREGSLRALSTGNGEQRTCALMILRRYSDDAEAQSAVTKCLNDPDPMVRGTAILALGSSSNELELSRAVNAAHDEPDQSARLGMIQALLANPSLSPVHVAKLLSGETFPATQLHLIDWLSAEADKGHNITPALAALQAATQSTNHDVSRSATKTIAASKSSPLPPPQ